LNPNRKEATNTYYEATNTYYEATNTYYEATNTYYGKTSIHGFVFDFLEMKHYCHFYTLS